MLAIPSIIYGTAWKKADTARLVALAIAQGFRGIDTACQPKHYDEAGVGAGLRTALSGGLVRSEVFLQTKFTPLAGQDPQRVPYDSRAALAHQVAQSLAASLDNLRTDYLDGLLLHSPMRTAAETLTVWRAFESLVDSKAVRQIGISNCGTAALQELFNSARIKPRILQNRFYAETGYDTKLRAFCRDHQITYQSFWTLTANPKILTARTLLEPAQRHGYSAAQILFRYLTQRGVVPLTGTKSVTHMQEDLAIFNFELTAMDLDSIDQLLSAPN